MIIPFGLFDRLIQPADDAFGAPLFAPGAAILTHCNAGALATAGYGTALGVIRACHERYGGAVSVFVDETRPWLQGARLTAWELSVEGIESHEGRQVHYKVANAAALHGKHLVVYGGDRVGVGETLTDGVRTPVG